MSTPIVSVGENGEVSVKDLSRRGDVRRLRQTPSLAVVARASSVLVASSGPGGVIFAAAPVMRKGQKPQTSYGRGKIHSVTVGRVADDGLATGVWRGFVGLHGGLPEIFLELSPSFPIPAGSSMRVVGVVDSFGNPARFRPGAWVPAGERAALFARDLLVRTASSGTSAEEAAAVMAGSLKEIARLRQRAEGSPAPVPLTCVPMAMEETPAQKGLRTRLAAKVQKAAVPPPSGAPRMSVGSTDWHGAVQPNGDMVIEIRLPPFAARPAAATVIVSRKVVATADGQASRIGMKFVFEDGTVSSLLLGGGPQHLAREIARRRSVVVVQGESGADGYGEASVLVAGVEKR